MSQGLGIRFSWHFLRYHVKLAKIIFVPGRRVPMPMRQKGFLVLLSLLLTVLVGELVVRVADIWLVFGPEERNYFSESTIPGVPYLPSPNLKRNFPTGEVITNQDGLRTLHRAQKADNVFRILALGDSFTFGFGVDQKDAYPQLLESLLNNNNLDEAIRYEVVNAGVDGFSVQDERHLLQYLLPKYRPDLLVWLLVMNDWDDSFGVNEKGQLDWRKNIYGASTDWVERTWGWSKYPCNPLDFFSCMGKAHQNWAVGQPYSPTGFEQLDQQLKKLSFFYAFFRSRRFPRKPSLTTDRGLIHKLTWIESSGQTDWLLPVYSIELSPYYRRRFYENLAEGVREASRFGTRTHLHPFMMPFEAGGLAAQAVTEDISQYFGMSAASFYQSHKLSWDSHLNEAGNAKLARSVADSLVRNRSIESVELSKTSFQSTNRYWRQYDELRTTHQRRHIGTFVDFESFQNIHQLIGGLFPPRTFPLQNGADVSLILKSPGEGPLTIRGVNLSSQSQELHAAIGVAGFTGSTTVPPGVFHFLVDPPQTHKNRLVDVKIRVPTQPNHSTLQLHYVGFGDVKTQNPVSVAIQGRR